MKKLSILFLLFCSTAAFCGEPLLWINPFRETFINFPSATLPDKTITVFLPEASVPLHTKYPVIYLLGAVPTDAQAARELIQNSTHKAILVGINVEEKDLQDTAKMTAFFSQELIPYIDTNYLTIQEPTARAIVASGAAGLRAAAALLERKQLFARAALLASEAISLPFAGVDKDLRVLVGGTRAGTVSLQQSLEERGFVYGAGFVTKLTEKQDLFSWLQVDYLLGTDAEIAVQKITATLHPQTVSMAAKEAVSWEGKAVLANQTVFDWTPLTPRMAPPYLQWVPEDGQFTVVPGAQPGKVKVTAFVDNLSYEGKIKLKK